MGDYYCQNCVSRPFEGLLYEAVGVPAPAVLFNLYMYSDFIITDWPGFAKGEGVEVLEKFDCGYIESVCKGGVEDDCGVFEIVVGGWSLEFGRLPLESGRLPLDLGRGTVNFDGEPL